MAPEQRVLLLGVQEDSGDRAKEQPVLRDRGARGLCGLGKPPHLAWQAQPASGRALSARGCGVCSQPTTSCADLSSPSAGLEGDKMSIM